VIVVDTTVWIDYLRGTPTPESEWLEREANQIRLGLTDLTLCEVLQGVRNDREFELVQEELSKFAIFETGGERLAVAAAKNFRTMRQKGLTVRKTIDCLIASFCILNGHSLLHRDSDFEPFERFLGLSVVHPK
jgi:predicted nucleic acid-binding protein